LIYTQLSNLPVADLVEQILGEFDAALAVHIMDDWPTTAYRKGLLAGIARTRMERRFLSDLDRADALFAISQSMATEYAARYGHSFMPVHNPVDLERWDALAAKHPFLRECLGGGTFKLVYAGRVGRANAKGLLDVARVVAGMSSDFASLSLHIFTPDFQSLPAQQLTVLTGVSVHPPVAYDEMPGLLEWADILLLPLEFGEAGMQFARLSMPTKVSEYLAAGRPILTYAPRGSAVAEYAREGGWAALVDCRDPVAVRTALVSLIGDERLRKDMGEHARKTARERHDASIVRAHFAARLAEATEAHRANERESK
jgi:glycosyltransferase involved in cell wall biosynthesis